MEEEEEKKYYGQGLRSDLIGAVEDYSADSAEGLKQLFRDPASSTQTVLGTGLTSNLVGNLKPGIIGSAAEKQMFQKGTASLTNPAYRNLLGKGIVRQGAQVAGIPVTAAVIAGDAVLSKSAEAQAEMDEVDAYQKSLEQQGIDRAQDQAMTMRKYNIIEEQRAAEEGRLPYGYDPDFPEDGANINVTNFRDYLGQVPADYRGPDELDFSSIDLSGRSQFPYYKDQSLNTGIDFSKFAQGEQPVTQPNLSAIQAEGQTVQPNLLTSANPDFRPEEGIPTAPAPAPTPLPESQFTSFLGNLVNQGVSADDRAAIAGEMLRGIGSSERNARNAEIFQRARDEYASKYGADSLKPKVGFDTETSVSGGSGMSVTDYRNLAKQEMPGAPSQVIRARANQMMLQDSQNRNLEGLKGQYYQAQIEKAKRPTAGRAPSATETQMGIVNQMTELQSLINAGQTLSPEQQKMYDAGNAFLTLQGGDFFQSPFQQREVADATILPSATDPEGEELIAQVMSRNPGKSREDVIAKLRSANKLS